MIGTGPAVPAEEAGPVLALAVPAEEAGPVLTLNLAAEAAVLRSGIDPHQAMQAGREVLADAERAGAVEPAVVALRAMALAARELGDLQAAERHLRRAIATPGAPRERVAQARLSLVTVRTERGHPLQALRIAALAWSYLSPLDRAKLDTQRAVALAHLGRYQEAVACCDRALSVLTVTPEGLDDRRFLAGGLLNRGLVHGYTGDWDRAMHDITACLEISRQAGLDHLTRLAAANLPFLAVRQGDIATAFAHYRASEDTLFGYPERLATMRADFAAALLAAHLPGEARALLSLAVPELEASDAHVALAEARMRLAQVELLTGDARSALEIAGRAKAELASQDRDAWEPLATEVLLRARLALGERGSGLLAELIECADALEFSPALAEGAGALRLVAVELALAIDDHATAEAELRVITATGGPNPAPPEPRLTRLASEQQAAYLAGERSGPAHRLVRQHALAMEAARQDDLDGAFTAALDGLRIVGTRVESLADPSVRAHAAKAGERLAAFALGLAIGTGSAEQVFGWAERWRAVAAVRALDTCDLAAMRAALGDAALVEFIGHDGDLLAVVVSGDGDPVLLRRLGAMEVVADAVVRLRYTLRRAALGDASVSAAAHEAMAGEVERLVLRPLADLLGDRPLVMVPTGPLHTLPWSALPYLHGRPVSVTVSACAWFRGRLPALAQAPVVAAAAGPWLDHAHTEVGRVLGVHRESALVPGRRAEVLTALDSADIFHLAAHGVFHARSPLLSSITLDDGPLMAHDLLGLAGPARLVVLSACDSGMARAPAEGASLGLVGTFLARGTSCVVAGLIPVPDEETVALMVTFHELVAAGLPPAAALATATAKTGVAGFTCFGAGDQPVSVSR